MSRGFHAFPRQKVRLETAGAPPLQHGLQHGGDHLLVPIGKEVGHGDPERRGPAPQSAPAIGWSARCAPRGRPQSATSDTEDRIAVRKVRISSSSAFAFQLFLITDEIGIGRSIADRTSTQASSEKCAGRSEVRKSNAEAMSES